MIEHGTHSMYTRHKCRCAPCKAAQAAYMRKYRARRAAGEPCTLVPAARARQHLLQLTLLGVGKRVVREHTGLFESELTKIRSGKFRRIRAANEAKILAIDETVAKPHARARALHRDRSIAPADRGPLTGFPKGAQR